MGKKMTENRIVPISEGPTRPLSLRLPDRLRARVLAVATATGNDLSTTLLHLARWGCSEIEREWASEIEAIDSESRIALQRKE